MKKTDPPWFMVQGTIQVPDWRGVNNHFQGIAPLSGVAITGQIRASADTWCASFVASGPAPARDERVRDFDGPLPHEHRAERLRHMTHAGTYGRFSGSQWGSGGGHQISSPTLIRVFGCSEDPSGDRDDYDFPIYYWR